MLIPHKPSPNLHSRARRAQQREDATADVRVTVVPWKGSPDDAETAPTGRRARPTGRAAAINRQPPP